MKILRIDHIGIAVQNLDTIKTVFENLFNLHEHFSEIVTNQKVSTVGYQLAESNIEFLEATSIDSPISKFIEKRGNAVHHIALTVENLDDALSELKEKNVLLIDEVPRIGAEGKRIAFIHPKSTCGILIELSELKK
jgi:methylmalonyl-CoA/ethylmalonyl-CoA epimerase